MMNYALGIMPDNAVRKTVETFAKILIFITVDIFKHTAKKKIRKLNEQIKFYLKCRVPP
jgi:hypothetical protein